MYELTSNEYYAAIRLGKLLGVSPLLIRQVFHLGQENIYVLREQPKPNGEVRIIEAPIESLRIIQRVILRRLMAFKVSEAAHGGNPGRSIVTNAWPHRNSQSIFGIDLEDAFGHARLTLPMEQLGIERKADFDQFRRLVEVRRMVEVRSRGVFDHPIFRNQLPQGAPTSPRLFDLFLGRMDARLMRLASNTGCIYTRYVDNIAFSSPKPEIEQGIRHAVLRIVTEKHELPINEGKTYYTRHANRPEMPLRTCGINIIDGELRLRPDIVEKFRMSLFCAYKSRDRQQINGILGYAKMVYGPLPQRLQSVVDRFLPDYYS